MAMVLVLLDTGIRAGELVGMQLDHGLGARSDSCLWQRSEGEIRSHRRNGETSDAEVCSNLSTQAGAR